MTLIQILFGLLLSALLGVAASGVLLEWRLPFLILPLWCFILFGLLVVVCTLGLLLLAGPLVCS
jgi:hypothetical protein